MKIRGWGALGQRTALTPEERIEKRHLIVRDALALLSLFGMMVPLFAATLLLFRSFVLHRAELAERRLARGEKAPAGGHPDDAIDALHSALAYDPSRRTTEIELAQALGAAGRTEEALAYFNTLLETEPGNGRINLELARLAARQGNQASEKQHYQFALDGTWQGDGYVRRREVRLELARYLLQTHDAYTARKELLIAAGNAPNDPAVKLEIGGLMEQAHDPANALMVYRSMMVHSE
jgi:tetratricopeptide (TPR) repeat protein